MSAFEEAFGTEPPYIPELTRLSAGPNYTTYCHKDRTLAVHETLLGFSAAELPAGARLLVIGPGATRRFERQLNEARPDIYAVSVDPLLRYGIRERHLESIRWGGRRKGSSFIYKKDEYPTEIMNGHPYFRQAAVCGGFVALQHDGAGGQSETQYNYLPFRDDTFDAILGLHSVPQYVPTEHIPALMADIIRVAKPAGHVALFPVLNEDIPAVTEIIKKSPDIGEPLLDDPAHSYFDSIWPDEGKRFSFTKVA